ncbi:DUF4266 domain-containing protein [Litorivivens sp.]|uniref:DUF4266 domain-containing protein n=1 Tax=Litorivivens sp. TaxID=2020868 RepID=UPI003561EC1C
MRILSLATVIFLLSACSVTRVDPWDRQYLARPEMAWDPDGSSATYRAHVYFSKEASNGGASAGGGGCGCN